MASRAKQQPPLTDGALTLLAGRFRAMGDPSRLRILRQLMGGERSVQTLLADTGLSQTNLSRHLGVLRREAIVERRADGNRALYRICDPTMVDVCDLMCGSVADRLAEDLEGFEGAGI